MDSKVTLKIQVGGVAVEVTGEPDYAEKKLSELFEKYSGIKAGPAVSMSSGASHNSAQVSRKSEKGLAPNEFLKKVAPKTQLDRGLFLAYYLEKHSSTESFTTGELSEICTKAKQPAFTNISDVVGKLVGKGWLMGAGEKDGNRAYSLTTTGEEQVESLMSAQG